MTFLRELAKAAAWGLSAIIAFCIAGGLAWWWLQEGLGGVSDGVCNIAVVPLAGEIAPTAQPVVDEWGALWFPSADPDTFSAAVRAAEADWNIQGILVKIDSPGGTPVASEIMANALKRSSLPTAALIRESGTSGAYLAASGADVIIASAFSDVGSLGITMSYLDNAIENESLGLSWNSLASAPFKDYLNPDKSMTEEERTLVERDLAVWHDHLVSLVAENRGLSFEAAAALADGSAMPGALAVDAGLVDRIWDEETAREWLAGELGIGAEEVIFCE